MQPSDFRSKVVLDTRYKKRDEDDKTFPAKIRIYHQGKQYYEDTGYSYTEQDFEKMKSGKGDLKDDWFRLQAKEKELRDVIGKMPGFNWDQYKSQKGRRRDVKRVESLYRNYIDDVRKEQRIGSAISYETSLSHLLKFEAYKKSVPYTKNFKSTLQFKDVTVSFLKEYENWMLKNDNSPSTVGIYCRQLRAIFNVAIKREGIDVHYPFGRFQYEIPSSQNIKKALREPEIAALYNYK
ncbi:MAG: phage integrase SAM-like domain-containing protein, partial [Chitinophagales bacterium]